MLNYFNKNCYTIFHHPRLQNLRLNYDAKSDTLATIEDLFDVWRQWDFGFFFHEKKPFFRSKFEFRKNSIFGGFHSGKWRRMLTLTWQRADFESQPKFIEPSMKINLIIESFFAEKKLFWGNLSQKVLMLKVSVEKNWSRFCCKKKILISNKSCDSTFFATTSNLD